MNLGMRKDGRLVAMRKRLVSILVLSPFAVACGSADKPAPIVPPKTAASTSVAGTNATDTPDAICARARAVYEKGGMTWADSASASCRQQFESWRTKEPAHYACGAKCTEAPANADAMDACMSNCAK